MTLKKFLVAGCSNNFKEVKKKLCKKIFLKELLSAVVFVTLLQSANVSTIQAGVVTNVVYHDDEDRTITGTITEDGIIYDFTMDQRDSFAEAVRFESYENIPENIVIKNYLNYSGAGIRVTRIAPNMFGSLELRKKIKQITLPNRLISISSNTFQNLISLESIKIPPSVCRIDDFAFQGCDNLKEVRISSSTRVSDRIFGSKIVGGRVFKLENPPSIIRY